MEFLSKIFGTIDHESGVGAILYPNRILIETQNKVKAGFWVTTDQITFSDMEIGNNELGEIVIKHLNLSKTGLRDPKQRDYKTLQEKYKKATGLKTIMAQMQDAKYVGITRKEGNIIFEPTINAGSTGTNRGYRNFENESVLISSNSTAEEIGKALQSCWRKCQ